MSLTLSSKIQPTSAWDCWISKIRSPITTSKSRSVNTCPTQETYSSLSIFHTFPGWLHHPFIDWCSKLKKHPILYADNLPPLVHTLGCKPFPFWFCNASHRSSPLQSHSSLAYGLAKLPTWFTWVRFFATPIPPTKCQWNNFHS